MKKLIYIHDPMCSWCWGFDSTWQKVKDRLKSDINVEYIVGGLAPDSDLAMPLEMQQTLQATWQRIQQTIPGVLFNFDFWQSAKPRRSTYPACRAVLAAKDLDANKEEEMIAAIQRAYYLQAKNPSDLEILVELAVDIELDRSTFLGSIQSRKIETLLQENISRYHSLPAQGFPALVLAEQDIFTSIRIDYNHPEFILKQIYAA